MARINYGELLWNTEQLCEKTEKKIHKRLCDIRITIADEIHFWRKTAHKNFLQL